MKKNSCKYTKRKIIRGDNLSKGSINNYIRASNKMVYLVDNFIIVQKYQKSKRENEKSST